ncbi:MAG: hypothetical protein OEO21_02720, partial [Candidatus Krumholzibacteria bacterium]|nr:hypothetical protein [Candidatus Krumholzibacteria bacterium]
TVVCLTLAAAFLGAAPAGAADEVHFAYKFEPGASHAYKAKFSQELDFGDFAMSIFVDMEYTETCTKVEDGAFTMELTFDKVDASRSMFDRLEEFAMGANLAGKTVTFTLQPTGEVHDLRSSGYVEGWDAMKQVLESVVEAAYPHLPDKSVAAGDEWTLDEEKEVTPQGIEIVTNAFYAFKEMKEVQGRSCACVETEVESTMGGTAAMPQGSFAADGEGKGKFEFYFDPAAGLIVKVKGKMDVRTDLTPEDGGDTQEMSVGYSFERELR